LKVKTILLQTFIEHKLVMQEKKYQAYQAGKI